MDNFDFSTSVFCIPNSVLVMYRDGLYSWAIFYLSTQCISTQYICFKNSFQLLSGEKPAPPARITPRYVKNNSMMRSKSSVVLNQHSDSDNDPKQKKMSRLMRPTISSHNKISQKPLQARKKQSYSTSKSGVSSLVILNVNRFFFKGNLNQIGVDNLSTSDEDDTPKKPQVPPRMSRQTSNFDSSQGLKRYINNQDPKKGESL